MKDRKILGEVFTPSAIVTNMLDLIGYSSCSILNKHIIDNSCGEGAFLTEIVKRYCNEIYKQTDQTDIIKSHLETYIHGIDIKPESIKQCIINLDKVVKEYGIYNVNWDVICCDALSVKRFNEKMDYVVGNPPYVRIHNIQNRSDIPYELSGMTDLYIAFYYLGLDMLSETGQLCYITPSSVFNSKASCDLRAKLIRDNLIETIVNYRHLDVFNAKTYSAITHLNKNKKDSDTIRYYEPNDCNEKYNNSVTLSSDEFYINGSFYFSHNKELKTILESDISCGITVTNGLATMCDKVFIGDFDFDSPLLIPIIKPSSNIIKTAIYPYNKSGKLLSEEEIQRDNNVYNHLMNNQELLLKRHTTEPWYGYGRTQSLKTTYQDKLAIGTYVKAVDNIKIVEVPAGTAIYSGLIIVSKIIPLKTIKETLKTREFCDYVKGLGHYKNGGYYTFNTKEIQKYLSYKLG